MQSYFARMLMKWLGQICPTKPGDPGMHYTCTGPSCKVMAYSSWHTYWLTYPFRVLGYIERISAQQQLLGGVSWFVSINFNGLSSGRWDERILKTWRPILSPPFLSGEYPFSSQPSLESRGGWKTMPTRCNLSILGLPNEVSYHQGFIQGIMLGLQPTKITRYHLCPQEAWGQLRSEYLWADSVWYLLLQVYTKCNGSNIDHLSVAQGIREVFYITGIIQAQNGRMSKCLPEDKWSDITIERTKDEASGEVSPN